MNSEPVTSNSQLVIWAPNPQTGACLRTCLEPFIAVFKTAVFGTKASLKCLMWCQTRGARTGRAEGEWSDEINQAGNKDTGLLCSLVSDFTPKRFFKKKKTL